VITYSGSLSSPFFSPSSNTLIGICALTTASTLQCVFEAAAGSKLEALHAREAAETHGGHSNKKASMHARHSDG